MFCTKCGESINDDAVICPKCGCATGYSGNYNPYAQRNTNPKLKKVAKAFMIVGTVFSGLYLLPLIWCLPMTLSYSEKIKNGERVSTGFKVCCLLFVNMVAGILMLCDNDNR